MLSVVAPDDPALDAGKKCHFFGDKLLFSHLVCDIITVEVVPLLIPFKVRINGDLCFSSGVFSTVENNWGKCTRYLLIPTVQMCSCCSAGHFSQA